MATPTLAAIDPATGHPGGKELIRITGTNFELPPDPPATGYVGGATSQTVEIEINGQQATEVKVWQSTEITCLTPPYNGDPSLLSASPGLSVDVVIRNTTGPEEATFTDAFAYKRTDFTREDGPLNHVLRTLLRELRRQVLDSVVVATTVDFDASTGDSLDLVELADIPAIALFGPDISEDLFRRSSEKEEDRDVPSLEYYKKRISRTSMLSFQANLTARSVPELLHLIQEFVEFFSRNPLLSVQKNSEDVSDGYVEFDMFLTSGPSRAGAANSSDIYSSEATFVIHGVPIDADAGTRIEWGKMVDTLEDVQLSYEEL